MIWLNTVFRIREDVYECIENVTYGFIEVNTLKCNRLIHVGKLVVKGIMIVDEAYLIGNGYINFLVCRKFYAVTLSKPIVVNNIYCEKAVLDGSKHPVIIGNGRVSELVVKSTLINSVEAMRVIMSERVGIKYLKSVSELFFTDSHCWIEKLGKNPEKIVIRNINTEIPSS